MKRLLLISVTAATGRLLASQLQNVLGDAVSIEILPIESGELPPALSADLILVARRNIAPEVNRRAGSGVPIVVHTRTLWRKDWQDLMAMDPGTRLLVVHNSLDNAMAYMATLYELGVRHLDLYPYAPGADLPPGVDFAITPGITAAVPHQVARVRDFGPRPLDAQTILEIMVRLDILGKDARTRLQEWTERTVTQSSGLIAALTWISELQQQTEVLLDFTQTGMITVDQAGTITQFNRKAEELLNRPGPDVVGTPLRALFPSLHIDTVLTGKGALINRLITAGQQELSLSCVPLRRVGRVVGAVTILHALQPDAALAISRQAERGHRARYTFSDIVGQSPALRSTLAVARQMAHSDSTVMIGGETGTGKEMLAQAIHNASWRRHGPFVAVNLAALTESLMESELFGYEEGSFTGAARGGRRGLFELAQQGTIFLDEIGDSTPAVQARLLRVLEERQVMRVGGGRLIPVDVRVIAATNRDLNQMVKEGSFRADLFYRLSVLPLTMPPLRERAGDIAVLAKHFLDIQGYRAPLPPEILAVLTRHSWPGNLRELRNCVEFMVTVSGGGEITALVEDPHEACASGGLEAIRYMLESTEGLAQKVYVQVSSATPASNVETTGGYIGGAEAREALTWARVIGLGELMDPPRIFGGDPRIWDLIQVAIEIGQPIEGHSGFGGTKLAAYAAAGVHDTHSPRTPNWAIEMLRRGFEIQLKLEREMATVPRLLSSQVDWSRIGLAVDDRAVEKLLEIGGLDHEVRESIRLGIPVMTAYQMATVNNARHWRLERDHGGIAPGRMADILVISDLAAVKVDRVFAGGREVARDGRMLQTAAPAPATPAYALGTVRLARPVTAADFAVQAPAGRTEVQALVLPPFYWGRREKEAITQTLQVAGGQVLADPARGINKVAIVERHKGTGKIGLSFGSWGFARGAVAMSVLHDSHNISVVGASEADMAVAVNRLAELQGGIVVAEGGRVLAELALPVYGMMSDRDPHQVAAENLQAEQAAASLRAGNEHTVDARWMAPQYLNRINAQPLDVLTFAFLTCDPWHYVVTDQGMFDMSDESPLPLVW